MENEFVKAFSKLSSIISRLRAPGGCPWDQASTVTSLRGNLVEECFELLDAIDAGQKEHIEEELGDVAINLVMMILAAQDAGLLKAENCLNNACEKLIRRHPHVFAPDKSPVTEGVSLGEVNKNWDKIKDTVEGRQTDHCLDQVPKSFPPLLRAYKLLSKACKYGWKWENSLQAAGKVEEELEECREAEKEGNSSHLEEECGDLLLAATSYVQTLGVNPETALNKANEKFYRRFSFVEDKMKEAKLPLDFQHAESEWKFWTEAKKEGF